MSQEQSAAAESWRSVRPGFVGVGLIVALDIASQYWVYLAAGPEPLGLVAAWQVALTQVSPLLSVLVLFGVGLGLSRRGRSVVSGVALSLAAAAGIMLAIGLLAIEAAQRTTPGVVQALRSAAVATLGIGGAGLLLLKSRSAPEGRGEARKPAE